MTHSHSKETTGSENGHEPGAKQADSSSTGSLLDQIQAFIRGSTPRGSKSSRKGSAKAASIQQHLMAVRYAENLDRQTNFRRSQVQRQVHRFEPQQSAIQSMSFRSDKSLSSLASLSTEREPIARLIYVLDQLIGSQNIIRLAQVMAKYDSLETSSATADAESNSNNVNINSTLADNKSQFTSLRPLDLDKISHRRLALALLKFLQDSIEHTIDELIRRDSRLYRSNVQISSQRSIDLTPNSRLAFGLRKSETSSILETSSSSKMRIDLNLIGDQTSQNMAPNKRRQQTSPTDQLSSSKQIDNDEDPIERTLKYIKGLDVKLAPDCRLERGPSPTLPLVAADAIQANQIQLHWSDNNHRKSTTDADELSLATSPSNSPIETRIQVSSRAQAKQPPSGRQHSSAAVRHLGASIERRTILRPDEASKSVTDSKQIDVSNIRLIREEAVELDTESAVAGHSLGARPLEPKETSKGGPKVARANNDDNELKRLGAKASPAPNSSGFCCSESQHFCCCCTRKRRIQRHKQRQHSRRLGPATGSGGPPNEVREKSVCLECERAYG